VGEQVKTLRRDAEGRPFWDGPEPTPYANGPRSARPPGEPHIEDGDYLSGCRCRDCITARDREVARDIAADALGGPWT
jgi:hypothetical protein